MTTKTDDKTPLEKHVEKIVKQAKEMGWQIEQVGYKDRVRLHATNANVVKK
jgi:hypothetical protein